MTKSSLTTHKWLLSAASQQGYSHRRNEIPNQDCYAVADACAGGTLVIAVADGAGSALHSDKGAYIAVNSAVVELTDYLDYIGNRPTKNAFHHLIQPGLKRTVQSSRERMRQHAQKDGIDFKDLATTLLIAVANDSILATAHIGDGAIIVKHGNGQYHTVSKPQNAEYANETYFITGKRREIINVIRNPGISAISLITDGLQPIAVTHQDSEPHPGFFDRIFETLLSDDAPELTAGRFEDFISSERVWRKTMDDVTIVAAVRKAGA